MPMVRAVTNLPNSSVTEGFEVRLTDLLAKEMGKPRTRIAMEIVPGARIIHGGSNDPFILISIRSIGALSPSQTVQYTKEISAFVEKELSIPKEKVVIEYFDLTPDNVGFNGTTVADANK